MSEIGINPETGERYAGWADPATLEPSSYTVPAGWTAVRNDGETHVHHAEIALKSAYTGEGMKEALDRLQQVEGGVQPDVNMDEVWDQTREQSSAKPVVPSGSAERKRAPLWSGLFRYFPDALVAVAQLSHRGNEKHNPGQPLHWSRELSNDHEDCLLRHLLGSGEWDEDNDCPHEVAVAWRALAIAQLALEKRRR
jgi:hypothetical protein